MFIQEKSNSHYKSLVTHIYNHGRGSSYILDAKGFTDATGFPIISSKMV